MALRMMLVGLVACMGLEIPSGGDISTWARSGRDWVVTGLADRAPTVEADQPPAVADRATSAEDRQFEAISEEMAVHFAADLEASRADLMEPADAPAMTQVPERNSVGLPEGEEIATLSAPADEAVAVAPADEPADTIDGAEEAPSRVDRLSSAVRLTREAARAWGALIQDAPDDAAPAY